MNYQLPEPEPVADQLPQPQDIEAADHQTVANDLGDIAILADSDPSIEIAKKILEEELKKPQTHGALWG